MTKQEILEREDATSKSIYLYKEGMFWKAYEYSAYRFVFSVMKCKPKKQHFKGTSQEMVHIGFPFSTLDTHKDAFRLISKNDFSCVIEPIEFLPQMSFKEWKGSITLTSNTQNVPPSASKHNINFEYVANKIRNFNIESKTPMDCMMFLVSLKKEING